MGVPLQSTCWPIGGYLLLMYHPTTGTVIKDMIRSTGILPFKR